MVLYVAGESQFSYLWPLYVRFMTGGLPFFSFCWFFRALLFFFQIKLLDMYISASVAEKKSVLPMSYKPRHVD